MFVATFQSSIAIGSLLGAAMVDSSGTRAAMYAGAPLATAALALTTFVTHRAGARTGTETDGAREGDSPS
jgi:predicted MFS family arabinose efflux permease